jgi:hypothetical protein
MKAKKHAAIGAAGVLALLGVYFSILTMANSIAHAVQQFAEMWYLISALVAGFGVQVGLYSYIREGMQNMAAAAEVTAAGGISTGSMIACCAHHLVDVLPVLGLPVVFAFLSEYQAFFMIIGILSNAIGVTMMLSIIQRHGLYGKGGFWRTVFKFDMTRIRNITIILSIAILAAVFVRML